MIGATGALSIVVGSMLGIGIFLMPGLVASHVGSLTGFFAVWLFGGAVALAGGSVYAALGSLFPRAGGDYVFLRESFGPSISFSASLLLFFGVFVGSIATTAVPLFEFQFAEIASRSGLNISADPIFSHLVWSPSWRSLGAISLIGALTIINAVGTTLSSRVQVLHAVWSGAATNAAVSQKIVEFTTDGLNAAPARELWLPNSSAMGTQCTASGSASSDGYGTTTLDG